ncbi:DUF5946 family protein [Flagellimonas allohymeniacidonis]|uniref:Uncharacterized protein n=1 Tax=Flagellimonas allohymeniacidonis TaxID=2517819 RepID=A0A4Q8QGV2_9FLAO|nr:DUF5946 family protein [Allomuricauda hymeniacidonis]TAI47833.1 hypothetical protein EW142_14355 [Allomuricauda hymeniacidonis]
MQDYVDLAEKNGVTLLDSGQCQFCGAKTERGIHECLEIFNLGFQEIDFSNIENHIFRFLIVDAHTLQHPEIHGRWNNHFHLSRLHLIFEYGIKWTYELSPKLSDYLNKYKVHKQNENLTPPEILKRGTITTTDIQEKSIDDTECKELIRKWALEVYEKWNAHHHTVDDIAKGFLNRK